MTNKIIVGIFIALIFSGCMTKRRLDRICEICPNEIVKERKDSIVFKDTIVELPGETIHDTIRIECDENNKPQIVGKSNPKRKKRKHNQPNLDQEFKKVDENVFVNTARVDSQAVAISWYENHSKELVTETIACPEENGWKVFLRFSGILFWILLLIYLLRKILRANLRV